MSQRLSICYAAPGHTLLGTSGSTRNILSLAKALGRWADVTVAFRNIGEPLKTDDFRVIAIEPELRSSTRRKDDVAARGLNALAHIAYLRKLHTFSRQHADAYDVVFEKGWRLSGFLSSAFRKQGVPVMLVENDVHHWSEPIKSPGTIAKYAAHGIAQCLAGFCSRQVPAVIAETEELKAMLIAKRRLQAQRIKVVELGVDHDLFRPLDQPTCRKKLGISPDAFVLLYVGGMDTYHDLAPLVDGLAEVTVPSLELHLVGDGELRSAYEARARRARTSIRFHGQVCHDRVPEFIASADLCIAPYRVSAFPNQSVCFSTLKIPEYMACQRAVVSVPSGHIKRLIDDQISGFLFANDVPSWMNFLKHLPAREKLQEMGRVAARTVASLSWRKTAERYMEVCQDLTARHAMPMKAGIGFEPH
jgi:glycosyltransferase involved in cell wall biosynthesis